MHRMDTQAEAQAPAYQQLKRLLKEANYDAALSLVTSWDLRAIVSGVPGKLDRLRFRCMISDVQDYGGLYPQAASILQDDNAEKKEHVEKTALHELRLALKENTVRDPALAKQQCWVLMVSGMTYYRRSDFGSALERFELARKAAELLHSVMKFKCNGTLARAWYCIGLVHREERRSHQAREAFREALRLAEKGIEEPKDTNQSTASFDFNMARAAGFGLAWIAYNEANLTEATAMLTMARRMMVPAKARLVAAYLDVIQASAMMSESAKHDRIYEALDLLRRAHSILAPEGRFSHTHHALRCQNEIALAFLRLARTCTDDPKKKEEHLYNAQTTVDTVKTIAKLLKTELKTYCTALVIDARIQRDRGHPDEALRLAEEAKRKGEGIESIQVDACIGIGEAHRSLGAYTNAISAFDEALKSGKDNRKDAAACHLQLCLTYLLAGQTAQAKEEFNLWEPMKAGLENAFLSNFENSVSKILFDKFQNFMLTRDAVLRNGNFRIHLNCVRRWLAQTALALENDDYNQAARRLCMSVRRLKQWLTF